MVYRLSGIPVGSLELGRRVEQTVCPLGSFRGLDFFLGGDLTKILMKGMISML